MVKKGDYADKGRESNQIMKIEAGNILSESVVNIKTIFSFNFQKKALELYKNILNNERRQFLKSALMQGFCVGMQTQTSNYQENEIKEDLYMLYLELKEELTSKYLEMSKKQLSETANTTNINIIIQYIREMVYILINTKL